MSLTTALSTAITGLQTAQQRVAIASNNVSNANTEGYSRKIAGQQNIILDGEGSGSQVTEVYRNVDEAMLTQLRNENGDLGRDSTRNEFFKQMQQMFGTPEGNSSITSRITDLADSLDALAADPEQNAPRLQVLDNAKEVIQSLSDMSDKIQELRSSAESQIETSVNEVNNSLDRIQQLNSDIVRLRMTGQSTSHLEDERDVELKTISEHLNISTFKRSEGDMVIYTGNGTRVLLDRTVNKLEHSAATTFAPGSGSNGISIDGVEITTEISTGKLNALIDLRDQTLPELQDQIDELSEKLRDEVNAIHNKGTSFPPPENLFSSRRLSGSDTFTGHGIVRVAVTDINGNIQEQSDFDLSGFSTVNDAVTAINSMTNLSATISNGQIQIEASNGNRISINEMDSVVANHEPATLTSVQQSVTSAALGLSGNLSLTLNGVTNVINYTNASSIDSIAADINTAFGAGTATVTNNQLVISDSNGNSATYADSGQLAASIGLTYTGETRGFSHYLGLNDFIHSDIAADRLDSSPQTDPTDAIGEAGTLRINGSDVTYTATDSLNDIATSINALANISASVNEDGGRYRLVITHDQTSNLYFNDTGNLAEKIGLDEDIAGISARMTINPLISNDAQRIAYAELNADNYVSSSGTYASDARPNIGGTLLGTGTLSIRGSFGTVDVPYDGTAALGTANVTLDDIAATINGDAALTENNIQADVTLDSASGGYVLRIRDLDGDPIQLTDSNAAADGLMTLTGLNTQFGVQSGDNSIAQDLANRFDDTNIDFDAAGGLTAETTSLADYSAAILSANATEAADASSDYEFQNTLVSELQTTTSNMSAVNIDEEMADLIVFQNAYAAAARVITSVTEMFDELLNSV